MPLDLMEAGSIGLIAIPSFTPWGMATGEIGAPSQTSSCPCTGEISAAAAIAVCTGEIGDGTLAAPTQALAFHTGHGRVLVTWEHDNKPAVKYFEIYASLSQGGPYFPYPMPRKNSTLVYLDNVPLGITLWLQVRAVGHNGNASPFSSVKRGIFTPIEGTLRIRAVSGTTIGAGVRFSNMHPESGEPITFKAVDPILVS